MVQQANNEKPGNGSTEVRKEGMASETAPTAADQPTLVKRKSLLDTANEEVLSHWGDREHLSGIFRGVAVAARKFVMVSHKVVAAKGPAIKAAIRDIGQTRPLAFASEGAVAGESIMPRVVYYGAWTLSGVAIASDIYTKQDDARTIGKQWQTAVYWTAFHLPASLVVPALIIHQVVHQVENAVENPKGFAKQWSPRAKSVVPVVAALASIVPVVPVVDLTFEYMMEPTLGAYLELEFDHHHNKHSNQQQEQHSDGK